MAKNKSFAAKTAKAKKQAMKESIDSFNTSVMLEYRFKECRNIYTVSRSKLSPRFRLLEELHGLTVEQLNDSSVTVSRPGEAWRYAVFCDFGRFSIKIYKNDEYILTMCARSNFQCLDMLRRIDETISDEWLKSIKKYHV